MRAPGRWLLHRAPVAGFGQAARRVMTSPACSVSSTLDASQPASGSAGGFTGGQFRPADGSSAGHIAFTGTSDNTVAQRPRRSANGGPDAMPRTADGHVLAGGQFTGRGGTGTRSELSGLAGTCLLP